MTPSLKHNRQSGKPQTTQQNHTTGLFSKTGIKSLRRTALPLAAGLLLGGCVVASAVDLAATTVFTVGKIAVKTTGAVVDAVADVVTLTPDAIKPTPQFERQGHVDPAFVTGIASLGERMLIGMDIEVLLSSDEIGLVEQTVPDGR